MNAVALNQHSLVCLVDLKRYVSDSMIDYCRSKSRKRFRGSKSRKLYFILKTDKFPPLYRVITIIIWTNE